MTARPSHDSAPPAPRTPSMAAALAVVEALVAQGVREAVLCPGSRNAPLAYALAQAHEEGALSLRVVLDERSAGFIALGIARAHALSGPMRPAAVVTTSGTAVANLHPAVCEADAAGIPLLLLTADRPHELVGTGANQTTEQTRLFGDAPRLVVDLPADLTSGLGEEAARAAIAGHLRRSVAAATGELSRDPGPVQVNLRFRPPLAPDAPVESPSSSSAASLPASSTAPMALGHPPQAGALPRPAAPMADQAPAGRRAQGPGDRRGPGDPSRPAGRRGIVVAGDTPYPGVGRLARALAEHLGWPLLAEPTSQARAGDSALTHYAQLLAAPAGMALADQATDIILTGHPSLSRTVTALLSRPGPRLHVLAERARWSDTAGRAETILPLGPGGGAEQVPDVVAALALEPAPPQWLAAWRDAVRAVQAAGAPETASPAEPTEIAEVAEPADTADTADAAVTAAWQASALPGGRSGEPLLVLGSSMTVRRLDRLAPPTTHQAPIALANRGLAGIDGTLATALGVALGAGRPVRAVVGDLTFLHDAMSLGRGALEDEPDLQILVIDDGGGAIFSTLEYAAIPPARRFARLFTTPQSADIPALAAALGARVHQPADLPGLRELLEAPVRGLSVVVWDARRPRDRRQETGANGGDGRA